jgi:hypothetical protein
MTIQVQLSFLQAWLQPSNNNNPNNLNSTPHHWLLLPSHTLNSPSCPPLAELTATELLHCECVQTTRQEQQCKCHALVKQKKLHELGLDMGNELSIQGLEKMQYCIATEGAPFTALQHDMGQQPIPGQPDLVFLPGHHGGQMFASTLLLSFLCTPLLKQHILCSLSMTNKELTSLKLIITQAWDQWDHQVYLFLITATPTFVYLYTLLTLLPVAVPSLYPSQH